MIAVGLRYQQQHTNDVFRITELEVVNDRVIAKLELEGTVHELKVTVKMLDAMINRGMLVPQ